SNELVLHVIELKTNGPAKSLAPLSELFHENILHINKILEKHDAKLMPAGTHPFMDPYTETHLWPHEYNPVYESYNRIFDCRGHGWSNLQSLHLNFPFANDDEFGKLHAAIRLILPILPAITASTPIIGGRNSGLLDARLDYYRKNQKKIPSLTGSVIPERVYTLKDYREIIFNKIYKDITPFDPDEIMRNEWLNSRGAIARFDRYTIEIRTVDIQECPKADIAIVKLVTTLLQNLISEKWTSIAEQMTWHEDDLSKIFLVNIANAENTLIDNKDYLAMFGFTCGDSCTSKALWRHIINEINGAAIENDPLEVILNKGTLASRILKAMSDNYSKDNIVKVYDRLSDCLSKNEMFVP
ncbi:MAG: glutamate-cysteine ligase family protein, partial [Bacteroidota bacterium]